METWNMALKPMNCQWNNSILCFQSTGKFLNDCLVLEVLWLIGFKFVYEFQISFVIYIFCMITRSIGAINGIRVISIKYRVVKIWASKGYCSIVVCLMRIDCCIECIYTWNTKNSDLSWNVMNHVWMLRKVKWLCMVIRVMQTYPLL